MKTPPIVSPQEWEAARQELLVKEKELTRARDALAAASGQRASSCASRWSPTGSFTRAYRRVATPASIRSITTCDSRSSLA